MQGTSVRIHCQSERSTPCLKYLRTYIRSRVCTVLPLARAGLSLHADLADLSPLCGGLFPKEAMHEWKQTKVAPTGALPALYRNSTIGSRASRTIQRP